jgi:acyl carrier protein
MGLVLEIPSTIRELVKSTFITGRIFFPGVVMINSRLMRTLQQTTQEVLDLAAKHFQLPAGSLAPEDDFFKKLGIDSLQALEMLSRLENHFGIELPDYEVQGVSDFKTLAERIQSRL